MESRSEIVRRAWVKRKANGWTPPLKGRKHSEESRAKMRATWDERRKSGRPHSRLGKVGTSIAYLGELHGGPRGRMHWRRVRPVKAPIGEPELCAMLDAARAALVRQLWVRIVDEAACTCYPGDQCDLCHAWRALGLGKRWPGARKAAHLLPATGAYGALVARSKAKA